MEAQIGDRIVIERAKIGQPRRQGEVRDVIRNGSVTYYRVRWQDGQETVFFPGPDARLEPAAQPDAKTVTGPKQPGRPRRSPGQMAKPSTTLSAATKFEVRHSDNDQYRWVLLSQGRILATSEPYTRKTSCLKAIESFRNAALTASIGKAAGPVVTAKTRGSKTRSTQVS
ncbi:MAG: DUF1918 domain-containing protein [Actinomycetota bacterium]|jgi:uncharacterized protein YegP (UPF0339 family)